MQTKHLAQISDYKLCVVGDNVASIAAATVLSHFGFQVSLYGTAKNVSQLLKRCEFDDTLHAQLNNRISSQRLNYYEYRIDELTEQDFSGYWIFYSTDVLTTYHELFDFLKDTHKDIYLSGISEINTMQNLSNNFESETVYYIPFVFLQGTSVYQATARPNLFLVGEKTYGTAIFNPIALMFTSKALNSKISDIKTTEFARSCMMNIIASKLSLINEMARLADVCQVDMLDVEKILALDNRIGSGFLRASWGFGGSTLPKETQLLTESFKKHQVPMKLIEEVQTINEDQKELIFRKFWRYFDSYVQNKKVIIWGAGYKYGTGRTKGSAIHVLLPLLWNYNITTYIYAPRAEKELVAEFENDERIQFIETAYQHINDVDALFIINWSELNRPDILTLNTVKTPIFDARNLLTKEEVSQLEGYYTGIGRGVGNM